jgi:leucyl-tRNA synthetase
MVCHETYKDQNNKWLSPDEVFSEDGKNYYNKKNPSEKIIVDTPESMSKSKKNTIDPEKMIKNYGADAVRLFILSDSPPEKDVQWSDQGMVASYKFIQKFWMLHEKIKSQTQKEEEASDSFNESLEEFTNQIINKININLDKFSYNVIIANLHEVYNYFYKLTEDKKINNNLLKNYIKILKIMIPIVPHLANECLSEVSDTKVFYWPEIEQKYLKVKKNNIVVQINGKKRGLISTEINFEEKDLIVKIKKNKELEKFFENKNIIKSIFIKNKLINLIIK